MKALVQDRYGPPEEVLRMAETPRPACGDDEVLVRVRSNSANPWDWHFIRGEPVLMRPAGLGGVRRPKFQVPGGDVAGVVEAVGGSVSGFAPGDEVYTAGGFPSAGHRYDMILQLGGTYSPRTLRRMLTAHGTLVQSFGDGGRMLGPRGNIVAAVALNVFVRQTLKSFVADEDTETLDELRELIDSGHVKPVIDSSFPLEQAAAAVSRVESGHPSGKVVVTVDQALS